MIDSKGKAYCLEFLNRLSPEITTYLNPKIDIIKLICNGVDINLPLNNTTNKKPITSAIEMNDTDLISLVMKYGANLQAIDIESLNTPDNLKDLMRKTSFFDNMIFSDSVDILNTNRELLFANLAPEEIEFLKARFHNQCNIIFSLNHLRGNEANISAIEKVMSNISKIIQYNKANDTAYLKNISIFAEYVEVICNGNEGAMVSLKWQSCLSIIKDIKLDPNNLPIALPHASKEYLLHPFEINPIIIHSHKVDLAGDAAD